MEAVQIGTIGYRDAHGKFISVEPIYSEDKVPRLDNLVKQYAAEKYNVKE